MAFRDCWYVIVSIMIIVEHVLRLSHDDLRKVSLITEISYSFKVILRYKLYTEKRSPYRKKCVEKFLQGLICIRNPFCRKLCRISYRNVCKNTEPKTAPATILRTTPGKPIFWMINCRECLQRNIIF